MNKPTSQPNLSFHLPLLPKYHTASVYWCTVPTKPYLSTKGTKLWTNQPLNQTFPFLSSSSSSKVPHSIGVLMHSPHLTLSINEGCVDLLTHRVHLVVFFQRDPFFSPCFSTHSSRKRESEHRRCHHASIREGSPHKCKGRTVIISPGTCTGFDPLPETSARIQVGVPQLVAY